MPGCARFTGMWLAHQERTHDHCCSRPLPPDPLQNVLERRRRGPCGSHRGVRWGGWRRRHRQRSRPLRCGASRCGRYVAGAGEHLHGVTAHGRQLMQRRPSPVRRRAMAPRHERLLLPGLHPGAGHVLCGSIYNLRVRVLRRHCAASALRPVYQAVGGAVAPRPVQYSEGARRGPAGWWCYLERARRGPAGWRQRAGCRHLIVAVRAPGGRVHPGRG